MNTVNIRGTTVRIFENGERLDGEFGEISEVLVADPIEQIDRAIHQASKVLAVDDQVFFLVGDGKFQVYDENGVKKDVSGINLKQNDHNRIRDLLRLLGFARSDHKVVVYTFGITDRSEYCGECWYDKACKLAGCGDTYCDWDNFDCEEQTYGGRW